MFTLNVRFQIAAILVLVLMIFDYLRSSHLKLLSTKYFRYLLISVICNLCFDMLTVYTITHPETVSSGFNRLCHQFFIASVIISFFMNYMYVIILGHDQARLSKKSLALTIIPLIISLFFIMFGKLDYYYDGTYAYSHGIMAYTVYGCGFLYLVLLFAITFDRRVNLTEMQRTASRTSLGIWALILIFQSLFPKYLLSGFGFVLIVLQAYFSFENPKENYDVETESLNRNAFHKMMSEGYESGKPIYIINVTCENFDRINSQLGHLNGIKALKYIKSVMERYFSTNIYHSRVNTFSMFIDNIEEQEIALNHLEQSLTHSDYPDTSISCRITVLDVRKYTESKDSAYELINFMTQMKLQGDSIIIRLNQEIAEKKIRRDKIEKLVGDALDNDGFHMVYQPIYWSKTGTFKSAEALLRLNSTSELGFISPEEFIPIAEEKGMIMAIGDKVIELVARFIENHHQEMSELEYIELNLSAIQASSTGISERITDILDKYNVKPAYINLEITETAATESATVIIDNMSKLKNKGFSFSMDDFGTGYSNLSQMSKLNYDLVKLDKSLIWPKFYENSEKAGYLLESVIEMLKKLEMHIVAEGVETKEMADYLIDAGVDYLQGYFYSKPIEEEKFLLFSKENDK